MERPDGDRDLAKPPSVRIRGEFPAIVEPALRDIPESPEPDIEGGFKAFEGERHDVAPDEPLLRVAREAALADERVRRALGDERFAVIGISRRVDDKERREAVAVLVAYRYHDDRAVEVWLGGPEEEPRVAEVLEVDYQPPPSDEELERAIELARGGRGVAEQLDEGWEATGILTSDVDPGDRHYGRRRFVVGFGPAEERQPRVRALVDLGAERVLAVEIGRAASEEGEEMAR